MSAKNCTCESYKRQEKCQKCGGWKLVDRPPTPPPSSDLREAAMHFMEWATRDGAGIYSCSPCLSEIVEEFRSALESQEGASDVIKEDAEIWYNCVRSIARELIPRERAWKYARNIYDMHANEHCGLRDTKAAPQSAARQKVEGKEKPE